MTRFLCFQMRHLAKLYPVVFGSDDGQNVFTVNFQELTPVSITPWDHSIPLSEKIGKVRCYDQRA